MNNDMSVLIIYNDDLVEEFRKRYEAAKIEIASLKKQNAELDATIGRLSLATNRSRHRAYEIKRLLFDGFQAHRGKDIINNNIRINLEAIEAEIEQIESP